MDFRLADQFMGDVVLVLRNADGFWRKLCRLSGRGMKQRMKQAIISTLIGVVVLSDHVGANDFLTLKEDK
jgi:hypothetical protein